METLILCSIAVLGMALICSVGFVIGKLHGTNQERTRVRCVLETATCIVNASKVDFANDIDRLVCSGLEMTDSDVRDFVRKHSIVKSERTTGHKRTFPDFDPPLPFTPVSKCIVCGNQHGTGMPCPQMKVMCEVDSP